MFVLLRRGSVSLSPQRSAGRGSGRGALEIPPLPGPLLQLRLEEREIQRSLFRSRIFSTEQQECLRYGENSLLVRAEMIREWLAYRWLLTPLAASHRVASGTVVRAIQ